MHKILAHADEVGKAPPERCAIPSGLLGYKILKYANIIASIVVGTKLEIVDVMWMPAPAPRGPTKGQEAAQLAREMRFERFCWCGIWLAGGAQRAAVEPYGEKDDEAQ